MPPKGQSNKPRRPRSGAPNSARLAQDKADALQPLNQALANDMKDSIEKNGVGKGEGPTLPPPSPAARASATAAQVAKGPKSGIKKPAKLRESELPMDGLDVKTPLGKAANDYADAIEALATAEDTKKTALLELIEAMKAEKRQRIKVRGYEFSYKHSPAKDSIAVKKAKPAKKKD